MTSAMRARLLVILWVNVLLAVLLVRQVFHLVYDLAAQTFLDGDASHRCVGYLCNVGTGSYRRALRGTPSFYAVLFRS